MRVLFKIIVIITWFSINLKAQSVGGTTNGGNGFQCDTINSGFIGLTGYTGNVVHWQTSNNGIVWFFNPNNSNQFSYTNLKQKTYFRAIVKNGAFPSDTSTTSIITIFPAAKGGSITTATSNFCNASGNFNLTLTNFASTVNMWQTSTNNGLTWSNSGFVNSSFMVVLSITDTTWYRAIVSDNINCPTDTSKIIKINVCANSNAGLVLSSDTVCKNFNKGKLKLQGNNGTIIKWLASTNNGLSYTSIANITDSLKFINLTQTTLYAAVVKNGVCPFDTSSLAKITALNAVQANAGNDVEINLFESTQLGSQSLGQATWSPSLTLNDATLFNPTATPSITTTYVLTQLDNRNCISKDSITVKVIIPIPSAITPNNDGANDFFTIDKIETFVGNKLLIFNKWGNVVFKAEPYLNDWNGKSTGGKELPDDTYFYVFDFGNSNKPVNGYVLIKR